MTCHLSEAWYTTSAMNGTRKGAQKRAMVWSSVLRHRFGGYESGRDRSVMARAMRRFFEKDGLQCGGQLTWTCIGCFNFPLAE